MDGHYPYAVPAEARKARRRKVGAALLKAGDEAEEARKPVGSGFLPVGGVLHQKPQIREPELAVFTPAHNLRVGGEGIEPLDCLVRPGTGGEAANFRKDFKEIRGLGVSAFGGKLRRRIEGRNTETKDTLEQRLARAEMEISMSDKFDKVILNDDLSHAVREVAQNIDNQLKKWGINR